MNKKKHIWQFSRLGGATRVNLRSGDDLRYLSELDQKLWTALSCPVDGLEIDSDILKLMDADEDGKIRVPEVIGAVNWILPLIKNADDLLERRTSLPLDAINDESEEGKILLASAKQILKNLNLADNDSISRAETSDINKIFADTKFNGDGIITENATDDEFVKKSNIAIKEMVASKMDRSGVEGISTEELEKFVELCTAYDAWHKQLDEDVEQIMPYGDKTENTLELFEEIKDKIDDYFVRCRLLDFDPSSQEVINAFGTQIDPAIYKDIEAYNQEVKNLPLQKLESEKALELNKTLNPAWREKILKFAELIGFKDASITELQWSEIKDKVAKYVSWKDAKPHNLADAFTLEDVRLFLSDNVEEKIKALIEEDEKLKAEADNMILVDKLVGYYCNIYTLLNNFVSFTDFYSPDLKGVFQAGTLYFDQRSCDLCVKVNDMGKHNALASHSGIFLVYLDCFSKAKNETMTIVAAFTDGDVDDLYEGRNAVFYDNDGVDWDATIVKIIENPISIRQAFWSPYRKISRFITKQIEKFASSQDEKVSQNLESKVESTSTDISEVAVTAATEKAEGKPAPAAFDIAKFAGIFAAIGLAIGAIGSVLTAVVTGFLKLIWWQMPLVLIGVMLLISGPSMILAWLKLRKRNLAPVLEANGWAINSRVKISIVFGRTLTHLAKTPSNSMINLTDPFEKKKKPIIPILIALLLVGGFVALWYFGIFAKWGWF